MIFSWKKKLHVTIIVTVDQGIHDPKKFLQGVILTPTERPEKFSGRNKIVTFLIKPYTKSKVLTSLKYTCKVLFVTFLVYDSKICGGVEVPQWEGEINFLIPGGSCGLSVSFYNDNQHQLLLFWVSFP